MWTVPEATMMTPPNNKSAASLTPFRALGKQSIHYGGRRIDPCWKWPGRHLFRGIRHTPFRADGCGESRPNPAGNEPAPTERSTRLTTPRPPRLKPPDPLEQALWRSKASEETRRIQGVAHSSCPASSNPPAAVHGPSTPHRPRTSYSRAQLSHRIFRCDTPESGSFRNASTECGYF